MWMRVRSVVLGALAAAGALLPAGTVSEAEAQTSNVSLTVIGTSTVRGWSCTAQGVVAITPGSGAAVPGLPNGVQAAVLTVPVRDMTCPDDTMTEHLMEAMHPDRNPTISFALGEYAFAGSSAQAKGDLTINGVTRAVEFPIQIQNGAFEGEARLDMTDYGVTPPTVLLGALRVRPAIRVRFEGSLP